MGSKSRRHSTTTAMSPAEQGLDEGSSFGGGGDFSPEAASKLQGTLGNSGVSAMVQTARSSASGEPGGDPGDRFGAATAGAGGSVPYRAEMEASFGQDFSSVDAYLGRSGPLDALGANAAASGEAVAFASASPSKHLVAHELTHVVQQRQSGAAVQLDSAVSSPGDASEREADAVARRVVSGQEVQVSAAPSAGVQLDGEGAGEGGAEVAKRDPMEMWDELLNNAAVTGDEILSRAAKQWGYDPTVTRQLLRDPTRRGKILSKVGAAGAPTLMLYWHVGIQEDADLGLNQAVRWCQDAGGLTNAGWARLVAGKTAEQCVRVIADAESLRIVRGLTGDPVVLFPALSEDPFTLGQVMTDYPDFVTWLRDVGGEPRVQQIRDYCQLASDAAAERQRLIDAGQWAAHLAALPAGPSTDAALSQQLYHWFLAEDQLPHMITLFSKRFGVDLTAGAEDITYTVVRGDTLWGLAEYYLGDGSRWPEIYNYGNNKDTIGNDPNLILPGQEITIPIVHDWDHTSIQRTWVICDKLPPGDVAFTYEILRSGSRGGAGGAAGSGSIDMSWGTDQIGDVDTGAFTDADDPMRGLNVFDGTMRHEIGHNVGEQGYDSSSGWVGQYGWLTFDSQAAITALFRDVFMPVHPLPLSALPAGDRSTKRAQILTAMAGASRWDEAGLQSAVDGVEAGLWEKISGEDLVTYILSRVERWESPDPIGSNTYHAPYRDWASFWQGYPTRLDQKKVSTYAMRSSMEWFAEVYATFYADADRPDSEVGSLLASRDAALAADFRSTIHGRHSLGAETGQTVGAPAPTAGAPAPGGSSSSSGS